MTVEKLGHIKEITVKKGEFAELETQILFVIFNVTLNKMCNMVIMVDTGTWTLIQINNFELS